MALTRPLLTGAGIPRGVAPGDVPVVGKQFNLTLSTVGAGTITGAQMTTGVLVRTGPTAGYTDTTDTAANIVAAVNTGFLGTGANTPGGVQAGTAFELTYINTVAFAQTLAAGTGVTLGSNTGIAASSVKDYLVTVNNGTPQAIATATVDGTTGVLTGMDAAETALVTPGMNASGTGIAASSVVLSVQPGIGVTLSQNTTIAGTNVAVTFFPAVTINSLGQKLL